MEIWKSIPSQPAYEASDKGRIRNAKTRHVLSPQFCPKIKYLRVNIYRDGKGRNMKVHRLVCEAFHGPAPQGTVVAHWNGDKLCNHASNLRWATARENYDDRVRLGELTCVGRPPLDPEIVLAIRAEKKRPGVINYLANKFGVSPHYVVHLRKRASNYWPDLWPLRP